MISARVAAVAAVVVPTLALGALSPVALKMFRSESRAVETAPGVAAPKAEAPAKSSGSSSFWNSANVKTLNAGNQGQSASLAASVANAQLRDAVTQAGDELKQAREAEKKIAKKQSLVHQFDESSLLASSADTAKVPAQPESKGVSLGASTDALLDPADADLIAPEALAAGLGQDGAYPTLPSLGNVELANVQPGPGIKGGPGISEDSGSSGSGRSRSARQETIASYPTDFGSNGFDDSFNNFVNPNSNPGPAQGSTGAGQGQASNGNTNTGNNGVTLPSGSTDSIFEPGESNSTGNGSLPTVPGPGAGALACVALMGLASRRRA